MNAQLATFKAPAVENEPMVSDGIRYLGDIIYPIVLIKINWFREIMLRTPKSVLDSS